MKERKPSYIVGYYNFTLSGDCFSCISQGRLQGELTDILKTAKEEMKKSKTVKQVFIRDGSTGFVEAVLVRNRTSIHEISSRGIVSLVLGQGVVSSDLTEMELRKYFEVGVEMLVVLDAGEVVAVWIHCDSFGHFLKISISEAASS